MRGTAPRAMPPARHARELRVGQPAEISSRGLGTDSVTGQVASVRPMMGKKTLYSQAAAEKHTDVVQVLIDVEEGFSAPVGLQVDVKVRMR